jgi:myo-inositol-1(or 4)-monophosphatase
VKLVAPMDVFEATARTVVIQAATVFRAAWRTQRVVHYKGPVDLVTDTDRALEALIVGELRQAFPDHHVVGEEGSGAHATAAAEYVWYVDPLDGTTNFAHGYPQCALSLGLVRHGEPEFGIVHDPLRDETFVGRRGAGATLNGEPIHVSSTDTLDRALLGTGFAYDRRERADFYLAFFSDFMKRSQGLRRAGSAALDLCWVACGRLDGFWEWMLKPWDTAAGVVIVREAGGQVSDFRGGPFRVFDQQTLASNGRVHAAMSAVLAARMDVPGTSTR